MMNCRWLMMISLGMLLVTACAPESTPETKGQLELDSVPQGAEVLVNSRIKLKKPTPVNLKLKPGAYLIKMSKENFQPVWSYVNVGLGRKAVLKLKLAPLKSAVLVVSKPAGARVVMNGKVQGVTPLVLTDLGAGEYSAQIEHLNRSPRTVKWEITDARPKKISILLESNIGQLVLNTEPDHARVYIDDAASGFTPYSTELQEGRHEVKVTRTGFADVKTSVDIVRDKTTTKTLTLVRLPGTFKFISSPDGALVYIDGKSYGKTPLTVADLPAGKYNVRVAKDGFDGIGREVHITPGRVNTVEFTLTRNTGGIDLSVNPPGVTVYINGKKHGETVAGESKDLSKVIRIRNLPAGKYRIMLAHKRMLPPTETFAVTVRKAQITRPKPINVWIANSVLKLKDEPRKLVLLLEKNQGYIIYSPEPGVKIKAERVRIEDLHPLTDADE
ncbi:MAG: PEGA domain-containing protein [Victivallaceae bacterium]|nr:PEGA domain-containing protein [Victivallaceae bacterium]